MLQEANRTRDHTWQRRALLVRASRGVLSAIFTTCTSSQLPHTERHETRNDCHSKSGKGRRVTFGGARHDDESYLPSSQPLGRSQFTARDEIPPLNYQPTTARQAAAALSEAAGKALRQPLRSSPVRHQQTRHLHGRDRIQSGARSGQQTQCWEAMVSLTEAPPPDGKNSPRLCPDPP